MTTTPSHHNPNMPQPGDHCWVLTDGKMGCLRQARGLAKALRLDFEEKIAHRKKPYYWLPPRWHWGALTQCHPNSDPLQAPWPDWVIACGYRTVPISLAIRSASQRHRTQQRNTAADAPQPTRIIHVQDPHIPPRYFDWVYASAHDRMQGPNVIQHVGALHDIQQSDLEAVVAHTHDAPPHPEPMLCVVMGGNTNHHTMQASDITQTANTLTQIIERWLSTHAQGTTTGSVWLLPSRRTPKALINHLEALCTHAAVQMITDQIDNAYLYCLAQATTLMVTSDSSSMISECCYTGKPVYVLPLPGIPIRKKFQKLIDALTERGACRIWDHRFDTWTYTPLAEAERLGKMAASLK